MNAVPVTLVSCGKMSVFQKAPGFNPDLVIDCRGIRNPYRDPKLGGKTGNDPEVIEWVRVENASYVDAAIQQILTAIETAPTRGGGAGKARLVVAFFCLAGQHRSPAMKNVCAARLKQLGYQVEVA